MKVVKSFIYIVLLVTFSWISLLLLSFTVFLVIVPFPKISNDLSGRIITSIIQAVLSSVLSLIWLTSLLVIRNYIARISVFR